MTSRKVNKRDRYLHRPAKDRQDTGIDPSSLHQEVRR